MSTTADGGLRGSSGRVRLLGMSRARALGWVASLHKKKPTPKEEVSAGVFLSPGPTGRTRARTFVNEDKVVKDLENMPSNPMVNLVRGAVYGGDTFFQGPYGPRPMIYADWGATGRHVKFIEQFLLTVVLPTYANTHTEASGTGLQTTYLREEAREMIKKALRCDDNYAIVFCGSGSTAAINKIVRLLDMRMPAMLDSKYSLSERIPVEERPVVFVGPYEHHSNELPWRETLADVVSIELNGEGHIDQDHLQRELIKYHNRPLKIGSFSSASNVTGIVSDTVAISQLLHRYGALAFWDYGAAGPYVTIDMTCKDDPLAYKDAAFISVHKFMGGPGCPGILAVRKELLMRTSMPAEPGGGTVSYVGRKQHDYLHEVEHREEGGTPAIVGCIKAGLVFRLKESVGPDLIWHRDEELVKRAIDTWQTNPNIIILGNTKHPRIPLISLLFKRGNMFLHHNYVVALLNDLFGIQARGGCSCAGPYGHRLLDIDDATSERYRRQIQCGVEGLKPGWVRVCFNFIASQHDFAYILKAVDLIALHGWKLLGDYHFNTATGLWRNFSARKKPLLRMESAQFTPTGIVLPHTLELSPVAAESDPNAGLPHQELLPRLIAQAEELFTSRSGVDDAPLGHFSELISEEFESLRWFWLPPSCLKARDFGN